MGKQDTNAHRDETSEGSTLTDHERPLSPNLALFAWNFLRHPRKVGWLLPSSRFLVNEVLKEVNWDRAKVIVEYGPGVGSFTTRVLERMRPDARLIAFEINADFVGYLRRTIRDPRLVLVEESATEVEQVLVRFGYERADYVISGIPFRTLSHPLRDTIVRTTHRVLRSDGGFLVYQFSDAVRPYLERVFRQVSRDIELLNILPARLFFCAP